MEQETVCYKFIDAMNCTKNRMKWGAGVIHTAKGSFTTYYDGPVKEEPGTGPLCSPCYIHAFIHPLHAAFNVNCTMLKHTPIKLYQCIGYGRMQSSSNHNKVGFYKLKTVKRVSYSKPTLGEEVTLIKLYKKQSKRFFNSNAKYIVNTAFAGGVRCRRVVEAVYGKIEWPEKLKMYK